MGLEGHFAKWGGIFIVTETWRCEVSMKRAIRPHLCGLPRWLEGEAEQSRVRLEARDLTASEEMAWAMR